MTSQKRQPPWWPKLLVLYLVTGLFAASPIISGTEVEMAPTQAPFRSEKELRQFTQGVIDTLATTDHEVAFAQIVAHSHVDDPTAQKNLAQFKERFPGQFRSLIPPTVTRFIQRSKFASSFIRFQYEISGTNSSIRCMFTYRRKADGWRLNQLICRARNGL